MNAAPRPTGLPSAAPAPPPPPNLAVLPTSVAHQFLVPVKRINDGTDVEHFHATKAYRDICTFILQLNRAVCPHIFAGQQEVHVFSLTTPRQDPEVVKGLQSLLSSLEAIISEVPPSTAPRRFGNASFRTWHQMVEQRAVDLLKKHLPERVIKYGNLPPTTANNPSSTDATTPTALTELKEYFMGGFGSPSRLDYGTGHELSFLAFLGCLWKLGAFVSVASDASRPGDVERSIVLGVIQPYLSVVRKLILTYTLEPAGSHGVWGLDDHSFLPYIFGSAQFTRPIRSEAEPMPLEGSCPGAPQPLQIANKKVVEKLRSENMYFSAIGFINDVKKGPFWEHSPTLFDISGVKDGWGKINKGMIKMFNAEVLGKFPVVQHFPFGSLFVWERDPDAPPAAMSTVHTVSQPVAAPGGMTTATFAPSGAGMAGARGGGGGLPPSWPSRSPAGPSGQMPPPPGGAHTGTKAPWSK